MKLDPQTMDFRDLHHLLAGAIVPRPIALVSTVGTNGVQNVAPLSSISIASVMPPMVTISLSTRRRRAGEQKDTLRNILASKEFVVNVPVTESMALAMNLAGAEYPSHVSEFAETGLTPIPADLVQAPMVAEAPVSLECRMVHMLEFGELPSVSTLIVGQVLRAHIKDEFFADGQLQSSRMQAIGRLLEPYCRTRDIFDFKVEYTL
ncbi:MAG: flavin reductase family protein [Burkholderiaceae bacterium]|nr:flavin reductase family protein [Burkholderiaceae bacterium]